MADSAHARNPSGSSADIWSPSATLLCPPGRIPPPPPRLAVPRVPSEDSSPRPSMSSGGPSYLNSECRVASSHTSVRSASMSISSHSHQPSTSARPGQSKGSVLSSRGLAPVPIATSDNDYLGFCKGAWKAQNGDLKGSMEKCKEPHPWSRNPGKNTNLPLHLKCQSSKCAFRSSFVASNADLIWDKLAIRTDKGIKVRWRFLAKSHVPQKVVLKSQYAYKCLICVYMGLGPRAGVYVGTEYYLDHINAEHRGQALNDVVLFKTGCIIDRIAKDDENFDINLWPLADDREEQTQQWLSDTLLGDPGTRPTEAFHKSSFSSNQPWVGEPAYVEDYDEIADVEEKNPVPAPPPTSPSTGPPQNVSPLQNIISSAAPPTAGRKSGKYEYESWEDNPEEIWGSNTQSAPPRRDSLQPPIPTRSSARPAVQKSPSQTATAQVGPSMSPMSQSSSFGTLSPHLQSASTSQSYDQYGIMACLNNVIQAFGDGTTVVEEMKLHPAFAHQPMLQFLEQTMVEAPQEIEREWQRGMSRFGNTFETGDYIAIIALSQFPVQLHNSVLDKLRRALYGGERIDLGHIADAADFVRQRTIATLNELKQRLMQAGSATVNSVPPTVASAMQQVQNEALQPQVRQYSHIRPDQWKDPYAPDTTLRIESTIPSVTPDDVRRQPEASDSAGAETRRRSSVFGNLKNKATRKLSLSKSPPPDVDGLAKSVEGRLRFSRDETLTEVAELDATPVVRGAR